MELGRQWVTIHQGKPAAELSLWAQNCRICGASCRSPWACDRTHVQHRVICPDHNVSGTRKQHKHKQFHAIPTRISSQGKGSCWFPKRSMVSPVWHLSTLIIGKHDSRLEESVCVSAQAQKDIIKTFLVKTAQYITQCNNLDLKLWLLEWFSFNRNDYNTTKRRFLLSHICSADSSQ